MPGDQPYNPPSGASSRDVPTPVLPLPAVLRPKLRPTLSRKVKYWGIAPSAHRKLGKEARRGSHDLRRLVGHANFLDELTEEFRIDDEAQDPRPLQRAALARQEAESKAKTQAQEQHLAKPPPQAVEVRSDHEDDGDDTASDSWSEYASSDDADSYALVRTESGRLRVGAEIEDNVDSSSDSDKNEEEEEGGEGVYGIPPTPSLTRSGDTSLETSPDSVVSEGTNDYFNQRVPTVPMLPLSGKEPMKEALSKVEGVDTEVEVLTSPGAATAR